VVQWFRLHLVDNADTIFEQQGYLVP
jgi:hypothetical protein